MRNVAFLLVSVLACFPAVLAYAATPVTVSTDTPQDILAHRCMVCHGCYDAPCQLKLEAHEGLERGASKALVYNGARLRAADLTRLFDDGFSAQQWRDKGFYPVLDADNPSDGVMYRMLQLKQAHPLPSEGPMPEGFDFSLYRDQQCPKQDEFDQFARDNPLWGMPYGLPGLNTDQHSTLLTWLEAGAPEPPLPALDAGEEKLVIEWETFLNGDSRRERLMSRYLYEHLFLASLYLAGDDDPTWFRLVRSRTAPGKPLELIATRRPYDDPGVGRVYYRLQRMPVQPLAKIHMPYRFDGERMARYRELFLDADYSVDALPGYAADVVANPFLAFKAIPVDSRYRFLLDEARYTIMNFIKGPVCRGQVALNVVDDHFWVMFVDPTRMSVEVNGDFLAEEMQNLRLPVPARGTMIDLLSWRQYAKANQRYQQARGEYINARTEEGRRLGVETIWDGDGHNRNAALTVFRHFDTASVEFGFIGNVPKTAWVIDFPLLERIHYLLVAGFDVYGAAAHQLESRLYMDFLRMEGETNFLLFLPPEVREPLWAHWYRNARRGPRDHFRQVSTLVEHSTGIDYATDDPKRELLEIQRGRIHGAAAENFSWSNAGLAAPAAASLQRLEDSAGEHNSFLPQVNFINVIGPERDEFLTLLRNSGYSNIAQLFQEEQRRLPAEDTVTVARGFIGAYPNYFFQVEEKELPRFVDEVIALKSRRDYAALRDRYGVHRNAPWFWRVSDKVHARYRAIDPVEYGLFDLNRYAPH